MKRTDIASRLPVIFGYSRLEAAASIGVSANTFDVLVADGHLPRPRLIQPQKVWDVDELRAAFKALPREGEAEETDSWAHVG